MNSTIGAILATVTMTLTIAACRTPARMSTWMSHKQDGGTEHGLPGVAVAEGREEIGQRAEDDHRIGDVADPGADPIAPGAVEADELPEPGLGIGIGPGIEFGLADGQRLIDEDQRQHADRGDPPADNDGQRPCARRHVLRQAEDAGADHRADDQRGERPESQLFARCDRYWFSGCGDSVVAMGISRSSGSFPGEDASARSEQL